MTGITFYIPDFYGKFLADILNNINLDDYVWVINNFQIVYEEQKKGDFLLKNKVTYGNELKAAIQNRNYYIIFADIKAFKKVNHVKKITTYNEFLSSPCVFALFIDDGEYVELYSKDESIINCVIENCKYHQFNNIKLINNSDIENSFASHY